MHINILHLLWIVPLSGSIGFFTAALLTVASESDREEKK